MKCKTFEVENHILDFQESGIGTAQYTLPQTKKKPKKQTLKNCGEHMEGKYGD